MNTFKVPESILGNYFLSFGNRPQLYLITGESGDGKTTACQHLIRYARLGGYQVAGLISPAVMQSGRKTAIDLTDISSGETRRLAWKKERAGSEDHKDFSDLGWEFDPAVLSWGNQILDGLPTCQILILDEIGPLEFKKQSGFTAGLRLLDEKRYQIAFVVVRLACLQTALERWPWAQVIRDLNIFSYEGRA